MRIIVAICLASATWQVAAKLSADEPPIIRPIDDKVEGAAEVDPKIKDFLAGEWVSQDKLKAPVIFEKDGKFTFGMYQKDGKWLMAKGTWRIGDDGRVRATASADGAVFGLWYRIAGEELHAPLGPNPKAIWKKVAKEEPKPGK